MVGQRLGANADLLRGALVATLAGAGAIHLSLTPEHFDESPIVGAGFLAAGFLQLLLAGVIFRRPSRVALVLAGVSSAALIVMYGVAVVIGLPFGGPVEGAKDEGLRLGAGEPVTLVAAITKAAEFASIVLAMVVLKRLNTGDAMQRPMGIREGGHPQ
jgi:hypothetical protein